ncbi:MAG: ATP-binding protein [Lachnospiraceae bacterium]|nr:ATP-binding protein [Lachnospiraceae bacterium]
MTAIFSNLLENAIDACGDCSNSFIDLNITRKSSTNLILVNIVNSCQTMPLTDEYGQLITSKSNTLNHGYGMKSVTNAINNYNGNIQFHLDPTTFTFHTIITLLEP